MSIFFRYLYLLCLLLGGCVAVAPAQAQQFAQLGDFKLPSGAVIRDCRIGYRTYGQLNADKSNVVVFTTWASGTTEQLAGNIGPGKMVDSSKYYVVSIDALGNGVSSSPSNSQLQPRMKFPQFTIRDMVETQHEVLTKVLGLQHIYAVMGISMGGMQTFQWLVAYPDFMTLAIPIVGSPQLAPYDLLIWQAQIDAIMNDSAWNQGNYRQNPARKINAAFGALLLTTPDNYNKRMTRQQVLADLDKAQNEAGFDVNNKIRQTQAMMALDIAAPFGGSLEQAAATVKARAFVIVARADHVVTPGPALALARLLNAPTMILDSDCGHLAPSCESRKVNAEVANFLDINRP